MRPAKIIFLAIGLALTVFAFQPDKRSDAVESALKTVTRAEVPALDAIQPKQFETATFGLG